MRELLYNDLKRPKDYFDLKISNPEEFIKTNFKVLFENEKLYAPYENQYAYTDLLINLYFIRQYNFLKSYYKRRFNINLESEEPLEEEAVDESKLLELPPEQVFKLKISSFQNFVRGMSEKVKLYSSDYGLLLQSKVVKGFNHYYDYSPIPLVDRIDL